MSLCLPLLEEPILPATTPSNLSFFQLDLLQPRNRKIINSCFDYGREFKQKKIGWCATCDPNAKRRQRGYCGPGETSKDEEAPIIYPNSTNWGFCDPKCLGRDNPAMIQARSHELLNLSNQIVYPLYWFPGVGFLAGVFYLLFYQPK